MISFRLNSAEKAVKILESVKLIRFAESLGGVESLLTYPMKQTHADVPVEVRETLGVDEKLLRMSVVLRILMTCWQTWSRPLPEWG
jgi:cystathionine gamma-synthase